jgi:hypothetical protein
MSVLEGFGGMEAARFHTITRSSDVFYKISHVYHILSHGGGIVRMSVVEGFGGAMQVVHPHIDHAALMVWTFLLVSMDRLTMSVVEAMEDVNVHNNSCFSDAFEPFW